MSTGDGFLRPETGLQIEVRVGSDPGDAPILLASSRDRVSEIAQQ